MTFGTVPTVWYFFCFSFYLYINTVLIMVCDSKQKYGMPHDQHFYLKKIYYLIFVLSDISTFHVLVGVPVRELVRNSVVVRIKVTKKIMVTNNYVIY